MIRKRADTEQGDLRVFANATEQASIRADSAIRAPCQSVTSRRGHLPWRWLIKTGVAAGAPAKCDAHDPAAGGRHSTAVALLTMGDCNNGISHCGSAGSTLGPCWAPLRFGHPVTCPAPGGDAELPGQLALGQRCARLDAGAVGGYRGGVDVRASGNH